MHASIVPLRSGRGACQFRLAIRADVASASTDGAHTGMLVLPHGTEYAVVLSSREEGDATVRIDGAVVGTFRVPRDREVVLDRPADVARRLTFYLAGTPEARAAALDEDDAQLGLVAVDFAPALPVASYSPDSMYLNSTFGPASDDVGYFSAGGTGLGRPSDQRFGDARPIGLDHARAVRRAIRIVGPSPSGTTSAVSPSPDWFD